MCYDLAYKTVWEKMCCYYSWSGSSSRGKMGGFARRYILFGEKMAVWLADEIIVLSRNMQEYFLQTYGRKTVFISNGVNKPQKKTLHLAEKKFGLKKDEYILFWDGWFRKKDFAI